jgi:hypothetical protein
MKKRTQVRSQKGRPIGEVPCNDPDQVDFERFHRNIIGPCQHESIDPETSFKYDAIFLTGQFLTTHLEEFSNYFNRLASLEATNRASPTVQS